ncbi:MULTISPECIES: methylation-associated defense system protein MAD7 [Streptomyces]|uniref:methylation-associated defense system protein MAD7 n=1 Tax=Streptomyces TaxID=1883 RepID=UPI0036A86069
MALRKRDSEFRHLGVSYLEFKRVEMDRVLTGFLMRVNHNGQPGKLTGRFALTSDKFVQEFLDEKYADRFQGFGDSPEMARRWIETQLLDMVNRGKPSQAVAGLRPLHGLTYKFRNYYHSRAYGADAQLYEMLRHARGGRGGLALDGIRGFFFNGLDPALGTALPGGSLDVETQAVLHLNSQVKPDTPQTVKGWYSAPPLCVGQSDLLADDVLRLLSLRDLLPRIVMVEYLKILFAFHLALGQLKTMKLLPSFVERSGPEPGCGPENCPAGPDQGHDAFGTCPFQVGLFADAAGVPGSPAAALAERSAEVWLRRIPGFVRAGYVVRKLGEFAEHMAGRGEIAKPSGGYFTVAEVLRYGGKDYKERREQFFAARMDALLDETPVDEQPEEVRPLLDAAMGLGFFEQYIELLMAYRGKYHNDYIIDTIDSLLLKNRQGAVIAQPYRGRRRFVLDSALLEVLVQIALLRPNPRGTRSRFMYHTVSLRLDEFMDILRTRYGLYVNQLPVADGFASPGFEEQTALRSNAEAFTTRMREIGFYNDLSDAYLTQVITPRFVISEDGTVTAGGR